MKKAISFLIGLLLVLISLEVLTRFSAYIFTKNQNKKNIVIEKTDKKVFRIVTVGESTTAVAANKENTFLIQDTAYPYLLEQYLNSHSSKYVYKVDNKGIMSGNSVRAVAELEDYLKNSKPDLIITMLGMKDHLESARKAGAVSESMKIGEWIQQNFKTVQLIKLFIEQYELNNKNLEDNLVVLNSDDINPLMKNLAKNVVQRAMYQQAIFEGIDKNRYEKLSKNLYLAYYYSFTGQYLKAVDVVKKLIEKEKFGYFALFDIYLANNALNKAENVLIEYIEKQPTNPFAYSKLISLYANENNFIKAEDIIKKAKIENLQNRLEILIAISELKNFQKDYKSTIKILDKICVDKDESSYADTFKAWLMFTSDKDIYFQCMFNLSEAYFNSNDYVKSEEGLRKLIKSNQELNTGAAFNLLLKLYYQTKKLQSAENLIQEMMNKNKRLGEYYAMLNHYKMFNKDNQKISEFEKNIVETFPLTVLNYKKILELARKAGSKLLIMQYPTFPISMMEKILAKGGYRGENDIAFLSNEKIFDNYSKKDVFFEPRYPYNFNHYTQKGANILAENIGQYILQKYDN